MCLSNSQGQDAARQPLKPQLSDLGDIRDLMPLRFRPACRAGSAHLMTPMELAAAIAEIEARKRANPKTPNIHRCLARFHEEQDRRETDSNRDRLRRMQSRLAWELAQEKLEELPGLFKSSRAKQRPRRY